MHRTPDDLIRQLETFELDLKFTAGVWFMSPPTAASTGRYKPDVLWSNASRSLRSLKDYGLAGLEAHYPNEVNEDNVHLYRQFEQDTGIGSSR